MPISLVKSTNTGYDATYHKLKAITVFPMVSKISITYYGYKDSASYTAGKERILTTEKTYAISDFPTVVQTILNSLEGYMDDKLLTDADWSSGTKV